MYVCEHTTKMASLESGHLYRVFAYIHSLLIEKDDCDRRNISIKFPCAFPMVISSIFGKSFPFLFPYFVFSFTLIRIINTNHHRK